MVDFSSLSPLERDVHFLRRSFDVARRAISHGNHPFGAILVDQNRKVLIYVAPIRREGRVLGVCYLEYDWEAQAAAILGSVEQLRELRLHHSRRA